MIAVTFFSIPQSQSDTSKAVVPLNINHHLYFSSNYLDAGRDFSQSTSAGSNYPARVFNAVYEDDFEWGGYLTTETLRELRIGEVHYKVSVQPKSIGTGEVPPSYDPSRVDRIRKDYKTANLRQDAADYSNGIIARLFTSRNGDASHLVGIHKEQTLNSQTAYLFGTVSSSKELPRCCRTAAMDRLPVSYTGFRQSPARHDRLDARKERPTLDF